MDLFLADADATYARGIALARELPKGSVLLLSGELGAGKTSLVQGIAAGLGITEAVTSPTFALAQHYSRPDTCLLYTSPSPRDATLSRMPSSA